MVSTYVPHPGDIVWLTFDPAAGHEQAGSRPALVVSRQSFNRRTGFAWFCPITSQVKGYPFEVRLPPGSATTGAILTDQCRSLDWRARHARYKDHVSSDVLLRVLNNLRAILADVEPPLSD